MDYTREFIKIAEGTCLSLNEVLDRLDIEIDWDIVDNEIFHCEGCYWWCEISEQKEDGLCSDCSAFQPCYTCGDITSNYDRVCDDCIEDL